MTSDDDARLQVRELLSALEHMKSCGDCAEDSWECCQGGREALAAMEKAGATKKAEEPTIERIEFPDDKGGLSLVARSPAFAALAAECVKMFKEDGGVNYVEWRMNSGDPSFGIFNVIIQRHAGETPAQQNGRLRTELREMGDHAARLRVCLLRYGKHYDHCASLPSASQNCDCGLEANIQAVPGQKTDQPKRED